MPADPSIPFLTQELRRFLRELDRVKRQIRALAAHSLDPLAADLPRDPDAIRDRLAAVLKGQPVRAQRDGYDLRSPDFPQAQYLMARLADETLAGFDWWGRGRARPLTDDFRLPAGVDPDLLQQIEDLLGEGPVSSQLAEVYLLVLAAGLAPAGLDEQRRGELERARRLLFDRIAHHRPDLLLPAGERLFPDSYRTTQSSLPPRYLPDPRPWWAALVLVVAGLLLASHWTYRNATADVRQTLNEPLPCESSGP
jgi:type VI protein secretion system component VasF